MATTTYNVSGHSIATVSVPQNSILTGSINTYSQQLIGNIVLQTDKYKLAVNDLVERLDRIERSLLIIAPDRDRLLKHPQLAAAYKEYEKSYTEAEGDILNESLRRSYNRYVVLDKMVGQ